MGTSVNITILEQDKILAEDIINQTFKRINYIESIMSTYKESSETSSINNSLPGSDISTSREMDYVLHKAQELTNITNGVFDITVLPLVELWGFHRKDGHLPANEEIARTFTRVGMENINISHRTMRLKKNGVKIDLSAIAKGYAVDEAVKLLKNNNIKNGIVEAGGDIYCLGAGSNNIPWQIGIKHPRGDGLIGTLSLKDTAVTTSGDYQNFFLGEKKRFSHIIDPRTGFPKDTPIISATVLAEDCITADGLSTALLLMVPDKAIAFSEKLENIEALIIYDEKGAIKIKMTDGIKKLYEGI